VACYHNDKPSMSFPIYNDYAIIDKEDRLIPFIGFPSLAMKIPHIINKISLRLQCVENLMKWYYRFRFYNSPEAFGQKALPIKDKIIYPTPTKWCDAILRVFQAQGYSEKGLKSEFKCPSAGEDKCHYAMNPNCEPNSPPDMVLLFETKAGWNQHGGPELFTFDNHEPRGGCVLLNDGTVKFIRTKEELQQLRWK